MRIFIEPLDVMLFRDGKPFSAGEDVIAASIFPPSPSTFYGAIRTMILTQQNFAFQTRGQIKNKQNFINQIDSLTKDLCIIGPFIADESYFEYFPLPKDVIQIKGEDKYAQLKPSSLLNLKSDLSTNPLWIKTRYDEYIEEGKGFISDSELKRYLEGKGVSQPIEPDEIFQREDRVGIKKSSSTKTTEEGFFYIVEYIRLNSQNGFSGFTLDIESNTELPEEGFLRLGGEARGASYKKIPDRAWSDDAIKEMVNKTRLFKLYLLTPSIFNEGWIAEWMLKGEKDGLRFRLVSACVGKPIHIGGFDIVEDKPKPMRKAVPAGSVYFFELVDGEVGELFKAFQFKSISDEKQNEGFGITLVGGWSNVQTS